MHKEKPPLFASLVSLLNWADTLWKIFGGLTLSGMIGFLFVMLAWIGEQPPYFLFLIFMVAFSASWSLLVRFVPSWFEIKKLNRIKHISWDIPENFLNIGHQKRMAGSSEDMVIWSPIETHIAQFFIKGRNNRFSAIDSVSGELVSNLTNRKIGILLNGMRPEETYGIPGKCEFDIKAIFPNSPGSANGYTVDDFWKHFGQFTFIFRYDGKEFKKKFSVGMIKKYIDKSCNQGIKGLTPDTNGKPRVKKREAANGHR